MLQPRRRTAIWLTCLVLAAVLGAGSLVLVRVTTREREPSRLTAPPQYAQANLRVDLSLETGEAGTTQPLRDYQVGRVLLTSLTFGMVHDAPAWAPWISTRPLNAPIVTDASGSTTLWFAVNPPPHLAGVHFSPEDGKANAPVVALYDVAGDPHWVIRDEQREMLAPDHWWIRLRLVERTDRR